MNVIDDAQANDQIYRNAALASHFAKHRDECQKGNGICRDCQEPIEPARLRLKPFALRCVDCQEKHERIYGR